MWHGNRALPHTAHLQHQVGDWCMRLQPIAAWQAHLSDEREGLRPHASQSQRLEHGLQAQNDSLGGPVSPCAALARVQLRNGLVEQGMGSGIGFQLDLGGLLGGERLEDFPHGVVDAGVAYGRLCGCWVGVGRSWGGR